MRRIIREQILEIFSTIREGVDYIEHNKKEEVVNVPQDCYIGIEFIESVIKKNLSEERYIVYSELFLNLKDDIQLLTSYLLNNSSITDLIIKLNTELDSIEYELIAEPEVKLEVAILPYKASMWTSLESIWKAADKDPQCNVYVIPIPYAKLDNDEKVSEYCYEGEQFPSYVPITMYSDFDFSKIRPDMIIIHNPYDDVNNLTRVDEEYYSSVLKKYTDMLVYSPYHNVGAYNTKKPLLFCLTPANENVHRVIVQSEKLKQRYLSYGYDSSKILALGSPKMDAIVECMKSPFPMPSDWSIKIAERPVFLLGTTISYFMAPNIIRSDISSIERIDCICRCLREHNCVMIWRPHPLEEAYIAGHIPELMQIYKEFINKIKNSDNGIIDNYSDYRYAFSVAKAMFTSHSSLVVEFMATQKQSFIIQSCISEDRCALVDYTFETVAQDSWNLSDFEDHVNTFIECVLQGNDLLRDKRKDMMEKAFVNLENGNSGEQVYYTLKEDLLNRN